MDVRPLTVNDVAWAVSRLGDRRAQLEPFAPVFWRPAADAEQRHREFLTYLLTDGGGVGFRTDTALMIAQPAKLGWVIDDAAVHDDTWTGDGEGLWRAVTATVSGHIRFVCPVPETARQKFARSKGFRRVTSWWHWNGPVTKPAAANNEPSVPGASASLVPAPPIYDPGGPILFLTEVQDSERALAAARLQAQVVGSPVVVVDQPVDNDALDAALTANGFIRHCDFLALAPM
jgi:hypothetical protein